MVSGFQKALQKKIPKRRNVVVTLPVETIERLKKGREEMECSMSVIVESALSELFDPHKEQQILASIVRRLTTFDRRLIDVIEKFLIVTELTDLFFKEFLVNNPELNEDIVRERSSEVEQRVNLAFDIIAMRLAEGNTAINILRPSDLKTK